MIKEQYPLSELTGKIIGCAMEVHRILENGFSRRNEFASDETGKKS